MISVYTIFYVTTALEAAFFFFNDTVNTECFTLLLPCALFFFNDTATTEIYTLSLHDALPISAVCSPHSSETAPASRPRAGRRGSRRAAPRHGSRRWREESPESRRTGSSPAGAWRSEEHTSELQSLAYLVCRLLLEKKKQTKRR